MITENSANFDELERDLERELNIFRSGSAPPTVEGSRTAINNLLGLDDLSSYYVNDNLNPRFRTVNSAIGEGRKKGDVSESSTSLFSTPPGFGRGDDGLGGRRKSFADAIQEGPVHLPPISARPMRPTSRNAYDTDNDFNGLPDVQFGQIHNGMDAVGGLHSGATSHGLARVQSFGSTMSQSFSSVVGSSLSRSITPDPNLFRRSSSFCRPSVERLTNYEKKFVSNGFGGSAFNMSECDDVAASLSGLNLSNNIKANGENYLQGQFNHDFLDQPERLYNTRYQHNGFLQQKTMVKPEFDCHRASAIPPPTHNDFSNNTGALQDLGLFALPYNEKFSYPEQSSSTSISKKTPIVGSNRFSGSSGRLTDVANNDFSTHNSNAYQALPAMLNNPLDKAAVMESGLDGRYLSRTGSRVGSGFQAPVMDPLYAQYLQRASDYTADLGAPSLGRSYLDTSFRDMSGYNKAYLATLLAQRKLSHDGTYLGKSGAMNSGLYENSGFGLHMPYPTLVPGSPLRQNDPLSRVPSTLRSGSGGSKGSWNHANDIMEQGFASTLLEEFKTNKMRSFELSEIADHVVEFSGDQYGSRFIQQKLETASIEEKNKLFPEILAHARVLMTDVFGNYVIQKFFEHGTEIHRNQLASQLMGHVLSLSLQMYGCRVIQKALEVVDVDQQTQMVSELDGSIMKCVRDQNGNHVIQKCIECVPQERIQFIISAFYGQVVTLSTHPYGCRVIQRVLEHCDDAKTQSIMMDEVMRSVCTLAQDQYGNYVIQHVLQHGKQEERAAIISKLAGQIVQMSQQKFASNVVEKCLTYGSPEERQILIDEMLGSTDENVPLQAMMKDQFGNYVVQKVLETCDDRNRELILSRVKVHLNALKRYTYGKHIVARVEKLITAGERRIGMPIYTP